MQEMVYSSEAKRKVLDSGQCMGFFYCILNLGTHPTAYVRIPENHPYYKKDYNEIDIDVHGGLTYSKEYLDIGELPALDGWFIGWDYAHLGDYAGWYEEKRYKALGLYEDAKKWTTEEIKEDVERVCAQLSKIKYEKKEELMDKKVLQKAINTYGASAQQDMVIEEALELALSILKFRRASKGFDTNTILKRKDNIIEESADTRIMLEQVNMMFECEDEVNKQIEYKINRLKERLEQ